MLSDQRNNHQRCIGQRGTQTHQYNNPKLMDIGGEGGAEISGTGHCKAEYSTEQERFNCESALNPSGPRHKVLYWI